MKVLLLSAYDARSHQLWRLGLCAQFPEHDWSVLSLPARHFAWRVRSNAMQWYLQNARQLNERYDLLIATSMVDLSSLRGLSPQLAATPSVLYFHENQFAYPQGNSNHSTLELQLTGIYSALAADALVFNSKYNRDTFLQGVRRLLKKMPDKLDDAVAADLKPKCRVLPVPLRDEYEQSMRSELSSGDVLQIVWNHRWEFDKGPERLLAFCSALLETQIAFQLHVVGQQFRQHPDSFDQLRTLLKRERPEALGRWGFVESEADYIGLLAQSHIVLSTAVHDFQGLAILEAIQAGCMPLLPKRLAYPEWVGSEYLYDCSEADEYTTANEQVEAANAVQRLIDFVDGGFTLPDISHLSWNSLRPDYEKLILQYGSQC